MSRLFLRHWLNRMAGPARSGAKRNHLAIRPRRLLHLETLEARCLPSTVTNLNDAGDGSLRQAIVDTPSGGTVDFQAGLSGTISLATGELAIGKDLTIDGPGADVITVSGNQSSRIFEIAANVTAAISGLTIADGFNGGGGSGIYTIGTLTLTGSVLTRNSGVGTAIYNTGTMTVINSTLSGNTLSGSITNDGTMDLSFSAVTGNSSNGNAGGIRNGGMMTIRNSTISGNAAISAGGGILNGGTLTITDSTISGNSSLARYGGGISNSDGATLTVTSCTISNNSAPSGGGIYNFNQGTLSLRNTILAGNSTDMWGVLNSLGHNLIGDGTGGSGYDPTDLVGTHSNPIDPKLGLLQDNGGPTQTMAVLAGSPALNAGDPNQLGSPDQRSVVRSGGVNIGAYQASATAFVLSAPDTVQAGVPFDVTVTAVDPFGQVVLGYTGTVTSRSSDGDPAVVLPPDYTFTAADAGMVVFPGGVTLITEGDQTIAATDTMDGTITGTATVTVTTWDAPLALWTIAGQALSAGVVSVQAPTRQAPHEAPEGQPARSKAASVPLATARHAQDAVFEGWDTVRDGLALNCT
jgi:hypothetical protein